MRIVVQKEHLVFLLILLSIFSGCSRRGEGVYHPYYERPKTYSHPTMKPYEINGIKYYPAPVSVGDKFRGNASWYGPDFHGKLTSNREVYDMHQMTAAHKTFPMNTLVEVTNHRNGKSTIVRINDRGPFVATRIIDLSNAAAKRLDMIGTGTAPVTLKVIGFADTTTKPKKIFKKKKVDKKVINGSYALQIASFTNISGAIKTQERYDGRGGHKTIIKDTKIKDGRIFKVLLKGFKSKQEAYNYKELAKFKHAFVVRED